VTISLPTGLQLSNVVAYLNEGVTSLQCHLTHMGDWRNITVAKVLDNGERYDVITVSKEAPEAFVHESPMKERVYAHVDNTEMYEVVLNMWIYVLACGDEGTYVCDAGQDLAIQPAVGNLQLLGKLLYTIFILNSLNILLNI